MKSRRIQAHIVIEPDTGPTTAGELTKAPGPGNSVGTVGARLIRTDPTIAGTSVDVLAASASSSREMLAAVARTAHTAVIKPRPLLPAVEGGFTLDDAAGTVTCPNGITRTITVKRRVTFGRARTGCPYRTDTLPHRGEASSFSTNDALQRKHLPRATDRAFKHDYRTHRPKVERTIAWLTRGTPTSNGTVPGCSSAPRD